MKPIRISEVGSMANCEQAWWYRYGDPDAVPDEDTGSAAMTKGTLYHAWWGEWWTTEGGLTNIDAARVVDAIPEDRREFITEEIADDVMWMMRRFDQTWLPQKDEWEMLANEVELEANIDGLLLQGRADGIVRHIPTARTYLAECKTMRDWRRLDILTVDPQLTHYWTLARACGYPIDGILYDAAKTYRWKRDEHKHPPDESFQRLFLDRSQAQADEATKQLHAFNDRRKDLTEINAPWTAPDRRPLRNISANTCSWCPWRARCWEELAFPETAIEISR